MNLGFFPGGQNQISDAKCSAVHSWCEARAAGNTASGARRPASGGPLQHEQPRGVTADAKVRGICTTQHHHCVHEDF